MTITAGFDNVLSIPEHIMSPFWQQDYRLEPIDIRHGGLIREAELSNRSITIPEGNTITFKITRDLYLYNYSRNGQNTEAYRSKYDSIYYNNSLTSEQKQAAIERMRGDFPRIPAWNLWVSASTLGMSGRKAINIADYKDFQPVADLITGQGVPNGSTPGQLYEHCKDWKCSGPAASYQDHKIFTVDVYNDFLLEPNNEWFMVQIAGGYSSKYDPISGWSIYIEDDTELPEIPLDFTQSRSQSEVMAVLSRHRQISGYVQDLKSILQDAEPGEYEEEELKWKYKLQRFILKQYERAVGGKPSLTLNAFMKTAFIAAHIDDYFYKSVTGPNAKVALKGLAKVKDKLFKAEIQALCIEHGRKRLTTSGGSGTNALMRAVLGRVGC